MMKGLKCLEFQLFFCRFLLDKRFKGDYTILEK